MANLAEMSFLHPQFAIKCYKQLGFKFRFEYYIETGLSLEFLFCQQLQSGPQVYVSLSQFSTLTSANPFLVLTKLE